MTRSDEMPLEMDRDAAPAAPELRTHLRIDAGLCGDVVECSEGQATVELTTDAHMVADDRGLVHGGFVFGAADYAAMVAVNDPNVVLGAAETRFLAPVLLGQTVVCSAHVTTKRGRKAIVEVRCTVEDRAVMSGTFTTFVLERHVLDR